MPKLLRWTAYLLGGIFGLLLIAAATIWVLSWQQLNADPPSHPEHLSKPTAALLADAPRRARALGCFGCHGAGLRGAKMIDDPVIARIWAPNLTEIAAHSTDADLARAIRQGISHAGKPLLIMPSEGFQYLPDEEVAAVIAVIRSQTRTDRTTPEKSLGPLGQLGIATGRFSTAPALVAKYAEEHPLRLGEPLEPGRHLAMVHCSACHGPTLAGKEVRPGDISPNLTIVGAYDLAAFEKVLRTGVPAGGQKLSLMGEVARSSLKHLNDNEIEQLHSYLVARARALSR